MTIIDLFRKRVEELGPGPCLWHKTEGKWKSISWKEVGDAVERYASALSSLGVTKGSFVGILASTRYEWTIIDMAILSLGAVVVPVYTALPADQIGHILKNTDVSVLFVENEHLLKKVEAVRETLPALKNIIMFYELNSFASRSPSVAYNRPSLSGDDVVSIIYTSGTTGVQKGVVVTHSNVMAEVEGLKRSFKLKNDDLMLTFLPLAHVLARAVQFYQLADGCQAAYAESIEAVPRNLLEVKPHMTVCVPRFVEKIYDRMSDKVVRSGFLMKKLFDWSVRVGRDYSYYTRRKEPVTLKLRARYLIAKMLIFKKLRSALGGRIRFIVSGGAPLSSELCKFFHGAGLLIIEGYGLTETFAAASVNRLDDFHLGTVGKPVEGTEIKLANDGEILIRGGIVFKGYHKMPEETKGAFTPDGWFKTGDIGEFSKDGFLRITDRKKDLIITAGGKNIAPQLIEGMLEESPFVKHAMIFGDKRRYISAVICLDLDAAAKFADSNGISYSNPLELAREPRVKHLITEHIEEMNKQLSQFETIKKFAILDHDFTVETGELTPTMKVRRRLIEERYKKVFEELYS